MALVETRSQMKPGDWRFVHEYPDGRLERTTLKDRVTHIQLRDPLGHIAYLTIRGRGKPNRPSWKWNEDILKPTLTPSINDPDGWHGYLREGKMVDA